MSGTAREVKLSDVFKSTFSNGRVSFCRPAKGYIHQFTADTECCLKELPGAMNYKERMA